MKRSMAIAAACLTALLITTTARAADPAPSSALSPKLDAALRQLTDESFSERQKAVKAIQQSLVDQMAEILKVNDPEAQAQLGTLLEFNDTLLKWAIESLKLPAEERASQLKWGVTPEIFPIISKIYSTTPQTRVAGIKELAKIPGPEASSMLARLILDEQREVYLAAMEAVWDRPATAAIVDALWFRTILAVLAYRDVGGVVPKSGLEFRGQPLSAVFAGNYFSLTRIQDNGLAADVLIQLNSPLVNRKAVEFLDQFEKGQAGAPDANAITYTQPLRNVYRIVETCKFRDALPILVKLASAKPTQKTSSRINDKPVFWSSRTGPIGVAFTLLKLDPVDYKIQRVTPNGSYLWTATNEAEEDDAVLKLQDYWTKHKAEFTTTTQPTSQPTP